MLADLLDLVLPRACCGCGAPGRTLCPACLPALAAAPVLHRPDPCPAGLPSLAAVAPYAGVVRAALLAHKEQGRLALAAPLGAALASAVRRLGDDLPADTVLVPVPSDPAAVRARGHDHARRLARVAARHLRLPAAPLLVAARIRGDQAGLDRAGRAANLDGALRARRPLAGRPVVLVDDLVTTGATLAEAARALRAAGADVRGAAVVGATARRPPCRPPPTGHSAPGRVPPLSRPPSEV